MRALTGFALAFAVACGASQRTPLRQVPTGLNLVGEDTAPTQRVSLSAALELRAALPERDAAAGLQPGDRTWFFRAFSGDELVFLECSYAPEPPAPVKRAGRWRVERRISLPRSADALDALGVRDDVRQYEQGYCGVRVGTSQAELDERLGEPTQTMYPAAAGCLVHLYGTLQVTVCHGEVTSVSSDGPCPDAAASP